MQWCLVKIPLARYQQAGSSFQMASFKVMSRARAAGVLEELNAKIVKYGEKEELDEEAERLNKIDVKF